MPYALCPMPYAQSYLIFLRKAITCLFHVSAVGVPGWVIGQKSKYKQGNKK